MCTFKYKYALIKYMVFVSNTYTQLIKNMKLYSVYGII